MSIECKVNPGKDRKKRAFDTAERADVTRRAKLHERILRMTAQDPRFDPQFAADVARVAAEGTWVRQTADLIRLSPKQAVRLQDYLVTWFGQKAANLGVDPLNMSIAGTVRHSLIDAQKTIEGMINTAGRLGSVKAISSFDKTMKGFQRQLRLTDDVVAQLMDDALTVGQIPTTQSRSVAYRNKALGRSSLVDVVQRNRYNKFITDMTDAGFSKANIDDVLKQATDVSMAFDQIRAMARAVGVEVGTLENLGYFTRIVTSDFKLRLGDLSSEELLDALSAGDNQMSTMYNRSRSTVHYIPEDEAFVAKFLNMEPQELRDMMDDPLAWRVYLKENVSAEQLDTLVDAGILEKLPMSSREVFDYYVRQYELPYKHLNDMFVTRPKAVMQSYAQSLMESAGNAAMLKKMLTDEAFDAGWAVTEAAMKADPALYSNFISLGSQFDRWAKQAHIPVGQVMQSMGMNQQMVSRLEGVFVHPVVGHQWSAIMATATNPSMMTGVASNVSYIGKWVSRRALTQPAYVFRQAYSAVMNTVAAGGSLLAMPNAFIDLVKAHRLGPEALDNTKKVFEADGQQFTKRELFTWFMHKHGQSVAPGTVGQHFAAGTDAIPSVKQVLQSPQYAFNGLRDMWSYSMAHGDPVRGKKIAMHERFVRGIRYGAESVNQFMEDTYQPFAAMANMMDLWGKWATFQTVVKKTPGNELTDAAQQIIGSLQSRRFGNLNDAFRHIDEYFVSAYDTGTAVAALNNYLMPFRTFAMANPPMQVRHMLRNPHAYVAYWRLRSILNEDLSEDDRLINGAVPGWIQENIPLKLFTDEKGYPVVLLPNNFDPIADAFVFVNETAEDVARIGFGAKVGTEEEKRAQARGESLQDTLLELASQTHAPIKYVIEQLMGRETFMGRSIAFDEMDARPTVWGIPTTSRIKHTIESMIPIVRAVDVFNPGGAFGVAPKYDHRGQIIDAGKLSWLGTERSATDRYLYSANADTVRRTMRIMGLNVQTIDPERNVQFSMNDISKTLGVMERSMTKTQTDIREKFLREQMDGVSIDRAELQRRRDELKERMDVYTALRIDDLRLKQWAKERNIPDSETLTQLRNLNMNLRDIPYPAADQIRESARLIMDEHIRIIADIERKLEETK